jgi:hypothetical protein
MSIRNLPGGKGRPACEADNLTADCLENVGASTSHNLHGLFRGIALFIFYVMMLLVAQITCIWRRVVG